MNIEKLTIDRTVGSAQRMEAAVIQELFHYLVLEHTVLATGAKNAGMVRKRGLSSGMQQHQAQKMSKNVEHSGC